MLQPGRSVSSGMYRFGYQGQEMGNAISGTTGAHTTAPAFLSTFNTQNAVTASNAYLVGVIKNPFFIYDPKLDRVDNQAGLWITYENGIPKFKRSFVFEQGVKFVTPYVPSKLSEPKEIKGEEKSKY